MLVPRRQHQLLLMLYRLHQHLLMLHRLQRQLLLVPLLRLHHQLLQLSLSLDGSDASLGGSSRRVIGILTNMTHLGAVRSSLSLLGNHGCFCGTFTIIASISSSPVLTNAPASTILALTALSPVLTDVRAFNLAPAAWRAESAAALCPGHLPSRGQGKPC